MTDDTPPAVPDAADVAARLKSILDYVADCERRVGRGEIMDLQGLDKTVVALCDEVLKLPRQDSRALEGRMEMLIHGLENLGKAMQQHQSVSSGGGRT